MARTLGILEQVVWGKWADRSTINENARDLDTLRTIVERQADEILQLRAMIMGVVEVLHAKTPFDDVELTSAIEAATQKLRPPKLERRTLPPESEEPAEAAALLAQAKALHYGKKFGEARVVYQQIVDQFPSSRAGVIAKQQVANLRNA